MLGLGLGLGLKANIFVLGLVARGLGLATRGLGLALYLVALLTCSFARYTGTDFDIKYSVIRQNYTYDYYTSQYDLILSSFRLLCFFYSVPFLS